MTLATVYKAVTHPFSSIRHSSIPSIHTQAGPVETPYDMSAPHKFDAVTLVARPECDHIILKLSNIRLLADISYYAARIDSMLAGDAYEMIVFCSPSHVVSMSQLVKVFLGFSSATRSNLRRLFMVHSDSHTKLLFNAMSAVWLAGYALPPIVYANRLSDLAEHVDISKFDIPYDVLEFNAKFEKSVEVPAKFFVDPQFGAPLSASGRLPPALVQCFEYVNRHGWNVKGIFRIPASTVALRAAQDAFDRGGPVDLSSYPESANVAAGLISLYFRSLPTALITGDLYESLVHVEGDDIRGARHFLAQMPWRNFRALRQLTGFFAGISAMELDNGMSARNLAVCITPSLLRSTDAMEDLRQCKPREPLQVHHVVDVVEVCIKNHYDIFLPTFLWRHPQEPQSQGTSPLKRSGSVSTDTSSEGSLSTLSDDSRLGEPRVYTSSQNDYAGQVPVKAMAIPARMRRGYPFMGSIGSTRSTKGLPTLALGTSTASFRTGRE